jgi:hypothetical protein
MQLYSWITSTPLLFSDSRILSGDADLEHIGYIGFNLFYLIRQVRSEALARFHASFYAR